MFDVRAKQGLKRACDVRACEAFRGLASCDRNFATLYFPFTYLFYQDCILKLDTYFGMIILSMPIAKVIHVAKVVKAYTSIGVILIVRLQFTS